MRRVRGLWIVTVAAAGCVRDAEPALCPDVGAGALVVTEIAGPQTNSDASPWIELYNASGRALDLYGMRIRFRRVDGSDEIPVIIRRSVPVGSGAYVALGLDDDGDLDAHLSYGFASDFHTSWLTTAAIDVEACGERIDLVRYDSLPRTGSYSLASTPPDATANDVPANWCTDDQVAASGVAGSPGEGNVPCP